MKVFLVPGIRVYQILTFSMASLGLHFRPISKIPNPSSLIPPNSLVFVRPFSSSASSDNNGDLSPHETTSPSSSVASYVSDVKASLKQQQQQNPQQHQSREPLSFTPSKPQTKAVSIEEIRKNLSEFRRLSTPPPPSGRSNSSALPPTASSRHVSFQELLRKNAIGGESAKTSHADDGGLAPIKAIRDSLRQLRSTGNNVPGEDNVINPMSSSQFRNSLRLRPPDPDRDSASAFGGSDSLSSSTSGNEVREKKEESATSRTQFVKIYTYQELGEKLRKLRPEDKGENLFSLEELNERLVKLRDLEFKESEAKFPGVSFKELWNTLRKTEDNKATNVTNQRFDILSHIGGTPAYMLEPPKEHLVEKYFHPDNMSSAEKLKLELQKVRDEFKMSESDCGSARVQVAQLTTKIKYLSATLHKKDKHSRKGLQDMVQRRKKLLKYLRRTDWDSYCLLLSKLGLRDIHDETGARRS